MGKLIDADELFKGENCGYTHWDYVKKKCGSLPEVIVLCKDCACFDPTDRNELNENLHLCKYYEYYMNDNDFCSHGVRRK